MSENLNLKEVERRVYTSTYKDGLWDIYYGLIVIFMSLFVYRPKAGYSALNLLLAFGGIAVSFVLFRLAKKYITAPRIGTFEPGEARKKKNRAMGITLGIFVFCQVILVGASILAWLNPGFSSWLQGIIGEGRVSLFLVSTIASIIVGAGMMIVAAFGDFSRGYYIALLMAAATFLMIFTNRPLLPILVSVFIIIPGVYLLIRFLQQHPAK
jgi:hypothetical protein